MIKNFIICVNKNIIKIKYNYTCLQSNYFKKIIINVKILKWNKFLIQMKYMFKNYLYIYNMKLMKENNY